MRSPLRRWRCPQLRIWAALVLAGWMVMGCKKIGSTSTETEFTTELKGGIRDREFIFLMVPHSSWTEMLEVYEFVVCRLKQKTRFHPAYHYIATSKLPHSPRSHMAAFRTKSPTEELLQALISEGNPYPITHVDALLDEDLIVDPHSCVPAYRGIRNTPMLLVSKVVKEHQINMAVADLSNAQFRESRQQGSHFLGAFGIGAAFSSFGKNELEALRKIIPSKYHQIKLPLGGLRKIPYVGGLFRFNWGNPGMANLGLGMFAIGQNKPFDVFIDTALDVNNYKVLSSLPGEDRTGAEYFAEAAALGGTAVGGFTVGRVFISRVASLVAKYSKSVGGQYGTVAAGLLIPMLTTVLIYQQKNASSDALDNFQQILTTMRRPTDKVGDMSVALSTEVRSYLPKVIHLLGKAFYHARWVSPFMLYSSCIPDDNPDGYTCTPLFPDNVSDDEDHKGNGIAASSDVIRGDAAKAAPPSSGKGSSPISSPKPQASPTASSTTSTDITTEPTLYGPPVTSPSGHKPPFDPIPPLPEGLGKSESNKSKKIQEPADSCFRTQQVSEHSVDRGLLVWQAYMNCRFYGGGASCGVKYGCRIWFADEASCLSRARELNSARKAKGSGVFSADQIERNCQKGRWDR